MHSAIQSMPSLDAWLQHIWPGPPCGAALYGDPIPVLFDGLLCLLQKYASALPRAHVARPSIATTTIVNNDSATALSHERMAGEMLL